MTRKTNAPRQRKTASSQSPGLSAARRKPSSVWKLEDAKAKFSEVVRRAQDQGPQYVTVRGKPSVAVIDVAELERLLPPKVAPVPLVQFLESLHVDGLDLKRDRDPGRDFTF